MVSSGIARRAAVARKSALLSPAAGRPGVKITAHATVAAALPAATAARGSASEDSLSDDGDVHGARDQGPVMP
jgi:hypothetical protein